MRASRETACHGGVWSVALFHFRARFYFFETHFHPTRRSRSPPIRLAYGPSITERPPPHRAGTRFFSHVANERIKKRQERLPYVAFETRTVRVRSETLKRSFRRETIKIQNNSALFFYYIIAAFIILQRSLECKINFRSFKILCTNFISRPTRELTSIFDRVHYKLNIWRRKTIACFNTRRSSGLKYTGKNT